VCNVRRPFCAFLVHVENGGTRIGDIKYCNLRRKSSIKTTTVCIVYLRGLQVLCNGRFLMTKWRGERGKVSVCALRGSEVKLACNKIRKKGEIGPSKRYEQDCSFSHVSTMSAALFESVQVAFNLVNKNRLLFLLLKTAPLCWVAFYYGYPALQVTIINYELILGGAKNNSLVYTTQHNTTQCNTTQRNTITHQMYIYLNTNSYTIGILLALQH